MTTLKLTDILDRAVLPSFPAAVMCVLEKIRDEDSSLTQIADAVQCDPGLTVRILKTVNSASFGARRAIENVSHAVSFLGRSQLESLVLALAVKGALPRQDVRGFESSRFWTSAAQRATLARRFAAELHPADQGDCFSIGLLQDMAVPILATTAPDEYGPVLEEWHGVGESELDRLEQEAFGWTHGEVGLRLADRWALPTKLADGIANHHGRGSAAFAPSIHLVSFLRETAPDAGVEVLIEEGRSHYGLEADWMIETVIQACEEAYDLAELLR